MRAYEIILTCDQFLVVKADRVAEDTTGGGFPVYRFVRDEADGGVTRTVAQFNVANVLGWREG